MKIRIIGTPQNISRRKVCKALRFYAKTATLKMSPALVETLYITVVFGRCRGFKASLIWTDKPERAKRYRMMIRETMSHDEVLAAVAHEFVHVKQFATGQLRDYVSDPDFVRWENEAHEYIEDTEFYWFAPWEIEAYGKERGLFKMFLKTQ